MDIIMKALFQDRFFTGSLFISIAFLMMAAFVRLHSGSSFLIVAALAIALGFVWVSLSNHFAEMRQGEADEDLRFEDGVKFGVSAR